MKRNVAASQTPLPALHAGEDKKFLSTHGTSTDPTSGAERTGHALVGAEHSGQLLLSLDDMRAAGQLVDLVLVDAQGARASAHRAVVAGAYMPIVVVLACKCESDMRHQNLANTCSMMLMGARTDRARSLTSPEAMYASAMMLRPDAERVRTG